MKYVAILVLLLGFTAPVHSEVVGKYLICHLEADHADQRFAVPAIAWWFNVKTANRWWVWNFADPVEIQSKEVGNYFLTLEQIRIADTDMGRLYVINRKTKGYPEWSRAITPELR